MYSLVLTIYTTICYDNGINKSMLHMTRNKFEFFTVVEFANQISAHPNTVRNAIKCGRIQAFRIGKGKRSAYRILKSEIERMIAFDTGEIIEKIVNERIKI